jgi:hypothetical protein
LAAQESGGQRSLLELSTFVVDKVIGSRYKFAQQNGVPVRIPQVPSTVGKENSIEFGMFKEINTFRGTNVQGLRSERGTVFNQEDFETKVQEDGFWVTTEDEKGVRLVVRAGDANGFRGQVINIHGADDRPIEKTWDEIKTDPPGIGFILQFMRPF